MELVRIGDCVRKLTLEVQVDLTGVRWFAFRFWIGSQFLKLAARVMGCGIEIKAPPCQE